MALRVDLRWLDNNYGESEHRVYRSTSTMDPLNLPAPLAIVGSGVTSYTDTTVVDATTYYYRISAMVNGSEYVSEELTHVVDSTTTFPSSNIVLHYTMDNISGSTVIDEESTNDGTLYGTTSSVVGYIGNARDFGGNYQARIETPSNAELQITGDLTLSLWVKMVSYPSNWSHLLSKFANDQSNEFTLRIKDSTSAMFYYGDGASSIVLMVPASNFPLGTWVHVAAVREIGTRMEVYVDGTLVVAHDTPASIVQAIATGSPVRVGGAGSGAYAVNAAIDQVRIYDVALNPTQIQNLANET